MSNVNLVITATVNPSEKEALAFYLEEVGKLYQKVGAKPVSKYKFTQTLIGDYTPSLTSIMSFQSIDSLNQVFESKEYKEILPYREKAFSKLEAYISEG